LGTLLFKRKDEDPQDFQENSKAITAMAEFNFYGSQEDAMAVLRNVLEPGQVEVVPDLSHTSAKPKLFRKATAELLHALTINRGMYLTGSFSRNPLFLKKITRGKYSGRFHIDLTRGGPAMSLALPFCKKLEGEMWHLGPGSLFYPRCYWDDAITQAIRPSDELKAAYTSLVKIIKSALLRRHIGKHVWIGREGLSLLEQQQALILVNGKWLNGKGRTVKSNI
jgi:hypothetical protein